LNNKKEFYEKTQADYISSDFLTCEFSDDYRLNPPGLQIPGCGKKQHRRPDHKSIGCFPHQHFTGRFIGHTGLAGG